MSEALTKSRDKYKELIAKGVDPNSAYGMALGAYAENGSSPAEGNKPEVQPTADAGQTQATAGAPAVSALVGNNPAPEQSLVDRKSKVSMLTAANDPGEADSPKPQSTGAQAQATGGMSSAVGELKQASGNVSDGSDGGKYLKLASGVKLDGVHPGLLKQVKGMAQEYGEQTGKPITVNDGFRTYEDQAAIARKHPGKAAKPGSSMHEKGLALDIASRDMQAMEQLGLTKKYGLTRPVGGEAWHTEPAGIQLDTTAAKNDPSWAAAAINASYGRGGGGFGTVKGAPLRKRNPELAAKTFNASGTPVNLQKPNTPELPTASLNQAEATDTAQSTVGGSKQYGTSKVPGFIRTSYGVPMDDSPAITSTTGNQTGSPSITRQDEVRNLSQVEDTLLKSLDIQQKILDAINKLNQKPVEKQAPAAVNMPVKDQASKPLSNLIQAPMPGLNGKINKPEVMKAFMNMAA